MASPREARTATKNDKLVAASVTSRSAKDGSSFCLWQDNRQKHVPGDHFSMARVTRSMVGAIHGISPKRSSISEIDSGNSNSSCYSSDENEPASGLVDGLNDKGERVAKVPSSSSKTQLGSSTMSSSTELGEIKQSVQRLRAQRTHVERLSQRNEELERQLAKQKTENETLQREVFTLRGTEQENVAYLQSVTLLEQRARELEKMCNTKKLELRTAIEKLNCVEHERDRLREKVQNAQQDHQCEVKVLKGKQKKLLQRIEQLEHSHGAQTDDRKRMEHHWKQKMKSAARSNSQTIDSLQQQIEHSCKQTSKFDTEVRELEEQVQNLLATTVRQTTVIEECDRVLSETKAQQQHTQRNYEEQQQLSYELSAKTQRQEVQIASLKQSKGLEAVELEKKVVLLENYLTERKDQLKAAEEALRDKDKEIEVMQRAYVTRDDNRLHLDDVNKKLRGNEKKLKSDISELQIVLRDATDEKTLLHEQVFELQEQLESERKDRSRWATARLKLLAEFCDEESKLSSALNHHNGISLDARRSVHKQKFQISPPNRKVKSRRATRHRVLTSYDGDDSERDDEQRRNSIVFG